MKYVICDKYSVLTCIWLLLISLLTVLKAAPEGLNADILINSVMSLQKITLYYWGQNRLLNVLPLAVNAVRNPTYNLAVLLFLTSLSFYGFLLFSAKCVALVVGANNDKALLLRVFVLMSSACVFIFSATALSEIAIGHIEYSLPSLLVVIVFSSSFSSNDGLKQWWRFFLSSFALFISVGLNPSTVIPVIAILLASVCYRKKINTSEIVIGLASVLAFVIWNSISKKYGNFPYGEFSLEILRFGFQKVVFGILSIVNLPLVILFGVFIAIALVNFNIFKDKNIPDLRVRTHYVSGVIVLFSTGWLVLFSSSQWVKANQYAWRYFIFIFFAFLFLGALFISLQLKNLGRVKSVLITRFAAVFSAVFLMANVTTLHFGDYTIFQRVNALSVPGAHLYAGDYWVVWPSVLRDMMEGYEAYGLTYRGEANQVAATNFVSKMIQEKGSADVYCLNDTVANCISGVNSVVGRLYPVDSKRLENGVVIIEFTAILAALNFKGKDLARLPSQVGVDRDSRKFSQHRAGFLVYGPYAPVKAGSYVLNVTGFANRLDSAFVDVVSEKGSEIYAKFKLKSGGDGYLLRDKEIKISEGVSDLEVRVWVDVNDDVNLVGYSFAPFRGRNK